MRGPGPALLALAVAAALLAPVGGVAQTAARVEATALEQNVPNPFTPGFSQTIIAYRLAERGHVRLTVYNRLAQEVAVLVDRVEEPGRYVVPWEGIAANGEPVPQGIYWYDLQVDGQRVALRQMRVLDSDAPVGEGEARPPDPESAPLAVVKGSRTGADRSSRRWWAPPR